MLKNLHSCGHQSQNLIRLGYDHQQLLKIDFASLIFLHYSFSSTACDLGVTLDSSLSFKDYISSHPHSSVEGTLEQRCQSGLKIGGRGSRCESWGLQVQKVQQKEAHSTGLRVSEYI